MDTVLAIIIPAIILGLFIFFGYHLKNWLQSIKEKKNKKKKD